MTVSSDLHRSSKSSLDSLLFHQTDWRSIYFITSIAMMDTMRISTLMSNNWPYISSIDPEISENFYGLVNSMFTLGENLFLYLSERIHRRGSERIHKGKICSNSLKKTRFIF